MPLTPYENRGIFMLSCDICKQRNKGRYTTRQVESGLVTACYDCWYGKNEKSDKQKFDELQIPFWKILGLKPKEKEVQLEKYLKYRGMSYGDYRRERDYKEGKFQSGMVEFNQHYNKYGTNNAPEQEFERGKNS